MTQMFELRIQATGEVRDSEGNLISSEPVEGTLTVTEDEAKALGLITEGEPS